MRTTGIFMLTLALVPGAALAQDDAAKKEQEKLQGNWQLVSIQERGKTRNEAEAGKIRLTVKADKFVLAKEGEESPREMTIKLDPAKKPKAIDLVRTRSDGTTRTALGIYKLEGDTLTICISEGKEDALRPTEFTAPEEVRQSLATFRKVKS